MSRITSDSRTAIQKRSLEVIFDILKDHGHLFSSSFWIVVFNSVVLPMFNCLCYNRETKTDDDQSLSVSNPDISTWDSETSTMATHSLVELFVSYFDALRSELPSVVSILTVLIRNPVQISVNTGLNALLRLTGELGKRLSEEDWKVICLALKEAIASTLPGFMRVLRIMDNIELPDNSQIDTDTEGASDDHIEDDKLQTAAYVVSRIKSHISLQLLIIQVHTPILSLPLPYSVNVSCYCPRFLYAYVPFF